MILCIQKISRHQAAMSNKDAGDIADAIAGALKIESRSPEQCKESTNGEQGKLVMFSTWLITMRYLLKSYQICSLVIK